MKEHEPTVAHPNGEAPGLSIQDLTAKYSGVPAVIGLNLDVRRSEFVTLLGPSGCGKTTTLRTVAGLHTPDEGSIHVDGRCVHGKAVSVPAHKRDINMVFQSYAVWPHMTALDNVAYGLRAQRLPRSKARAKASEILEMVGLGNLGDRDATALSGGQQQRVALARALATEPRLVLMDEPLSNLDARLRVRMREEIRQLQRATGTTVLYVTHDQTEALSMSDRIVVMREGVIEQEGDPWTLYNRPANRFVAGFLGEANILDATVLRVGSGHFEASVNELAGSRFEVAIAAGQSAPATEDEVTLVLRPEWLTVADPSNGASASSRRTGVNEIAARLRSAEFLGDHVNCLYEVGAAALRAHLRTTPSSVPPKMDSEQVLTVPPESVAWFARQETPSPPAMASTQDAGESTEDPQGTPTWSPVTGSG